MKHAIIIGAGISGLIAAYQLKKSGRDIILLESSNRTGGVIHSEETEGFLLERGPNSLRGTHEFLDLVDELNIQDELITAPPQAPAYVYTNNKLHPVPMSPLALLKSELISTSAKFRLLREPLVKKRLSSNANEESIASFIRRRFGNQVLDKMMSPFLSGIYAGDPEMLSVQACFPKLAQFEKDSGSVVLGAIRSVKQSRKTNTNPKRSLKPYRLCSFTNGLQTFTNALNNSIRSDLITNVAITNIEYNQTYKVSIEHNGSSILYEAPNLIIATTSYAASQLLSSLSKDLSRLIGDIPYVSLASVPIAYRSEQVAKPLDGFGFLSPRKDGLRILGSIWNSSLFETRAPNGWALLTNFVGGASDPDAVLLSDNELYQTVHNDLKKVIGINGDYRRLSITRYNRAIPQYNIGHAHRVIEIESELSKHKGLYLLGNYLHGVSLGDCIKNASNIISFF